MVDFEEHPRMGTLCLENAMVGERFSIFPIMSLCVLCLTVSLFYVSYVLLCCIVFFFPYCNFLI